MNRELIVSLGDRAYPVWFRDGARDELVARLAQAASDRRIVLVTDTTVGPLHADSVADDLRARGVSVCLVHLAEGEAHKDVAAVQRIYDAALAFGIDRGTPLVAFGGGLVGDVAGFAAATLLRGLPFIQVPTTLLAQVDSSVGGKTGVNHGGGKNLVGAFHQPAWVFSDLAWLATLPARHLRGGLAEVVKHAALASRSLLDEIAAGAPRWLAGNRSGLGEVVYQAVAIKAAVVAADEREAGERALLNLGHTLGHAIEAVSAEAGSPAAAGSPGDARSQGEAGSPYEAVSHGEAVALGCAFAAELSRARAGLGDDERDLLVATLRGCGLPVDWRPWIRPDVLDRLTLDKKTRGNRVNYILLNQLGRATIVSIPLDELRAQALALASDSAVR